MTEKKKTTTKKESAPMAEKKKAEEKELVEKKPQEGKLVKPDQSGSGSRGFENFGTDDLIIPYAKLMQPLSPELDDMEDVKAGQILNSMSQENYGTELTFIPLIFQKKRIKWIPREEGGGIECQSPNGRYPTIGKMHSHLCRECEYSRWTEKNPPECIEFLDFLSLTESGDIITVSFARTSFKAGKQLVNTARFSGGDLFSKKYTLFTKKEKNDKGTYFVYSVKPAGLVSEDEYEAAEKFYNYLKITEYTIHTEETHYENVVNSVKENSGVNKEENFPIEEDLPY
jgi:hypothetical protein